MRSQWVAARSVRGCSAWKPAFGERRAVCGVQKRGGSLGTGILHMKNLTRQRPESGEVTFESAEIPEGLFAPGGSTQTLHHI